HRRENDVKNVNCYLARCAAASLARSILAASLALLGPLALGMPSTASAQQPAAPPAAPPAAAPATPPAGGAVVPPGAAGVDQRGVFMLAEVTITDRIQKPSAAVDVSRIQLKLMLAELRQPFLDRIETAVYKDPF